MQKVAKEHLGYLAKNPSRLTKPSSTSLDDPAYLHYSLQAMKVNLFTSLGKKMALAGKAG